MKYLILFTLLIPNAFGNDFFEVGELSISYRKYFPKNYDLLELNKNVQIPNLGVSGYPISLDPIHIQTLIPQIENISDINLDLKIDLFKYVYYRGNIDLYSFRIVWYDTNEYTLPKLSNSLGIDFGVINLEYTNALYPVNNKYLNNFFPQQNSIMFRLMLIKEKK